MPVNVAGTGAERDDRPRVGVCSWSLQPGSALELAERVRECGLDALQLALDPLRTGALPKPEVRAALEETGIVILSGMMAMAGEDYSTLASIRRTGGVVPDATWAENVAAAAANARLARALGIGLVTFHAGFVPPAAEDPRRGTLVARVAALARCFAREGVAVALETGQEGEDTLLELLAELDAAGAGDVGVNFDPANLILYGMGDPVAALRRLAPFVRQVHIKDAVPAVQAGEWGTEVPVGEGAVDWRSFFRALQDARLGVDLVIEREAGDRRVADVRGARALVERLLSES